MTSTITPLYPKSLDRSVSDDFEQTALDLSTDISYPYQQALLGSILTAVLTFMIMIYVTIPNVEQFAPGMKVPDLQPQGYSASYLFEFLTIIGATGRDAYLVQLGMDLVYPFLLALSFFLGFKRYFFYKSGKFSTRSVFWKRILYLLSWTVMLFDYLENLMIFLQITAYPTKVDAYGYLAPIFSVLKSFSTSVVYTVILVIVIQWNYSGMIQAMRHTSFQNWRLLTISFSGVIGLGGLLLRGSQVLPGIEGEYAESWITTVTSPHFMLANYLILFAYLLPLLGFWELFTILKERQVLNSSDTSKISWGFFLSVFGTILALPTFGIIMFSAPIAAEAYSTGNVDAMTNFMAAVISGLTVGFIAGICYTIGPLLYSYHLLKLQSTPLGSWSKLSLLMFGTHGTLLSFGFGWYPLLILGWIFFIIGGLGVYQLLKSK